MKKETRRDGQTKTGREKEERVEREREREE